MNPLTVRGINLPDGPYHLLAGGHTDPADGMCFNELVAFIAGEKHSEWPECASPVIRRLGMRLNDRLDDERRQLLLPFAYRSLGTATDGREEERRQLCNDWVLHTALPRWLDLADCKEAADRLRSLPADLSVAAVLSELRVARDVAYEARRSALARLTERI